jgi:hypothetical protein
MDDACSVLAEHKRNLSIGQAEMLGERLATRQDYGQAKLATFCDIPSKSGW